MTTAAATEPQDMRAIAQTFIFLRLPDMETPHRRENQYAESVHMVGKLLTLDVYCNHSDQSQLHPRSWLEEAPDFAREHEVSAPQNVYWLRGPWYNESPDAPVNYAYNVTI
ncbi:hypothetical protein F0562_009070 [Nyssa sinensis]|uniref:Uncharacterized protein n=1 Tax=Nyssa sinensis TaxID=561372 RepID=A0A5J5ABJ0_9ASTE|nr:hypothetical protein F0562_009070 [Nyssa sinensis]